MPTDIHRYTFDSAIAFEDVEASLLLAIFAAETRALCRLCGHELHLDSPRIAQSQVVCGSLMSPTWQRAVRRIHENHRKEAVAL